MIHSEEQFIQLEEVQIHLRSWQPSDPDAVKPAFLLLHGLSSNARTWDFVARNLAGASYSVFTIDQRGHGLSEKPNHGYGFTSITSDLNQLVQALELENIILAGQSWGGNVVLEAAVRYPELARALAFVDGGFLHFSTRGTWEEVSQQLRPPDLAGMRFDDLANRIQQAHPNWSPEAVEMTMGNFELLRDGTVSPWLALENHMTILRALYEQDVLALFPQVPVPVLICAADDGSDRTAMKRTWVETAVETIPKSRVRWFEDTAHDIHVDRPDDLVKELIEFASKLV